MNNLGRLWLVATLLFLAKDIPRVVLSFPMLVFLQRPKRRKRLLRLAKPQPRRPSVPTSPSKCSPLKGSTEEEFDMSVDQEEEIATDEATAANEICDTAAKYFMYTSGFQPRKDDDDEEEDDDELNIVEDLQFEERLAEDQVLTMNAAQFLETAPEDSKSENNSVLVHSDDNEEDEEEENDDDAMANLSAQEEKARRQKEELVERIEMGVGKKGNLPKQEDETSKEDDDLSESVIDKINDYEPASLLTLTEVNGERNAQVEEQSEEPLVSVTVKNRTDEDDIMVERNGFHDTRNSASKDDDAPINDQGESSASSTTEENMALLERMVTATEPSSANGKTSSEAAADGNNKMEDDMVRRLSEAFEQVKAEELARLRQKEREIESLELSFEEGQPPRIVRDYEKEPRGPEEQVQDDVAPDIERTPAAVAAQDTTISDETPVIDMEQIAETDSKLVLEETTAHTLDQKATTEATDTSPESEESGFISEATVETALVDYAAEVSSVTDIVEDVEQMMPPHHEIEATQQDEGERLEEEEAKAAAEDALRRHQVIVEQYKSMTEKATGWEFQATIGPGLYLTGVGVRKRAIANVYAVAMYTAPDVKDALMIISKKDRQQAVATLLSEAKAVRTSFLLTSKKALDHIATVLGDSILSRLLAQENVDGYEAEAAVEMLKEIILLSCDEGAKGTRKIRLDCDRQAGVTVVLDGEEKGSVPSESLSAAVIDTYLDEKSVTPQLRESCLQTWCAPERS